MKLPQIKSFSFSLFENVANIDAAAIIVKFAFTLAEVLIVIGIIGVIAECTIPTLIQNSSDQVIATRFKKEVSSLQQAVNLAYSTEGPIDAWIDPTGQGKGIYAINNVLSKYLKITKSCPDTVGCLPTGGYKYMNKNPFVNFDASTNILKIQLADGSIMMFNPSYLGSGENVAIYSIAIYIDVNGVNGPNMYGLDLFSLSIASESYAKANNIRGQVIIPDGQTSGFLSSDCSYSGGLPNCAAWVLYKGNLDYKYNNALHW